MFYFISFDEDPICFTICKAPLPLLSYCYHIINLFPTWLMVKPRSCNQIDDIFYLNDIPLCRATQPGIRISKIIDKEQSQTALKGTGGRLELKTLSCGMTTAIFSFLMVVSLCYFSGTSKRAVL